MNIGIGILIMAGLLIMAIIYEIKEFYKELDRISEWKEEKKDETEV